MSVARLRIAAELPGDNPTDRALADVLRRVGGDVELAADAIAMSDRPKWLAELIGPTLGRVSESGDSVRP